MPNSTNDNLDHETCPIMYGLNIISKKWMLPIICELNRKRTMRYSEIKRSMQGISNLSLTQVLKELVEKGLVDRVQFNEVPPHVEYSLTKDGYAILPSLYGFAQQIADHMDLTESHCICASECYGMHYTYLPVEFEAEVQNYPRLYDARYEARYLEIQEKSGSVSERLENFLLAMLEILTEDGIEQTRWAMIYYFRKDTPNIMKHDRPQYRILAELIEEGHADGTISDSLSTAYLVDQFSKFITGSIGDWLMAKCSYDLIEESRQMTSWLCTHLK